MSQGIVFVDVDHTLLRGASGIHVLGAFFRARYLTKRHVAASVLYHLIHRLGLLNHEDLYAGAMRPFVGKPLADVQQLLAEVYRERIRDDMLEAVVDRLVAHHRRGDRMALLSGSSVYLLEMFRHDLPLDRILGFRQHVVDGNFVFGYDQPACYGLHKLVYAADYAAEIGADPANCTYYADSITDRHVLEWVGHPVAVNPDPFLKRLARRRGWEILRTSRTVGGGRA